MSLLDSDTAAKRTKLIVFLLETSDKMRGVLIGAINDSIRMMMSMIRELSDSHDDVEIKVAAMTFSNGYKWLYNEPKNIEDFEWINQSAEGGADLGEACLGLEKVLHQKTGWMGAFDSEFHPTFILFSATQPTDDFNTGITALLENYWFLWGSKVAIAIGSDADTGVLAKFTGKINRVWRIHEVEYLKFVFSPQYMDDSELQRALNENWFMSDDDWDNPIISDPELDEALKDRLEEVAEGIDAKLNEVSVNDNVDDDW